MKKLLSIIAVSALVSISASSLQPVFTNTAVNYGFKSSQINKCNNIRGENDTNEFVSKINNKLYISNGIDVNSNKYPWFASFFLGKKFDNKHYFFNGGILIDSEWILTAGHVAEMYSNLKDQVIISACFGLYNREDPSTITNTVEIDKFIFHNKYIVSTSLNKQVDLALLHLKNPITNIRPIRLISSFESPDYSKTTTIMGFGQTNNFASSDDTSSMKLQEVKIPLQDGNNFREDIKELYEKNINKNADLIAGNYGIKRMGGERGDSGCPLFQIINNEKVLIGIEKMSLISEYALPGLYVSVSKNIAWILKNMNYSEKDYILNQYKLQNYMQIFNHKWNPGFILENKISYTWKGTYATPMWGQLNYYFDPGYAYIMYLLIAKNEEFKRDIKNWIITSKLPNNLKMSILKELVINHLKIKHIENTDNFDNFMNSFWKYFDSSNRKIAWLVDCSIYETINDMKDIKDASWIKSNFEPWLQRDIAYDGGLNYFYYYNSQHPEDFANALLNSNGYEAKKTDSPFMQEKKLMSERTSGGYTHLSYIKEGGRKFNYHVATSGDWKKDEL